MVEKAEALPPLLTDGQVEKFLEIRPGDMIKLRPHLHHLQMPGDLTRRYSRQYLTAITTPIGNVAVNRLISDADRFVSRSRDAARLAVDTAERQLRVAMAAKFIKLEVASDSVPEVHGISIPDFSNVLYLDKSPSILQDWLARRVIIPIEQGDELYVDKFSIHSQFRWFRPLGYPGDPIGEIVSMDSNELVQTNK